MTVPEPIVVEAVATTIYFSDTVTLTGSLTLSNDCSLRGSDADRLEISGSIGGPGGFDISGGTLRLSGSAPNTFAGSVQLIPSGLFVSTAILELAKPNNVVAVPGPVTIVPPGSNTGVLRNFQNGGVSDVSIHHGGSWQLNGHSVAPGSLTFHGDDSWIRKAGNCNSPTLAPTSFMRSPVFL